VRYITVLLAVPLIAGCGTKTVTTTVTVTKTQTQTSTVTRTAAAAPIVLVPDQGATSSTSPMRSASGRAT